MAKRRKRRVNLGSAPSVHAKRARRLIHAVTNAAESAERLAGQGKCNVAQNAYENSLYHTGEYRGHADSIGKHGKAFSKAAHFNLALRAQIAARKALEMHCGRPKAIKS